MIEYLDAERAVLAGFRVVDRYGFCAERVREEIVNGSPSNLVHRH
jgi:hypothetical protein